MRSSRGGTLRSGGRRGEHGSPHHCGHALHPTHNQGELEGRHLIRGTVAGKHERVGGEQDTSGRGIPLNAAHPRPPLLHRPSHHRGLHIRRHAVQLGSLLIRQPAVNDLSRRRVGRPGGRQAGGRHGKRSSTVALLQHKTDQHKAGGPAAISLGAVLEDRLTGSEEGASRGGGRSGTSGSSGTADRRQEGRLHGLAQGPPGLLARQFRRKRSPHRNRDKIGARGEDKRGYPTGRVGSSGRCPASLLSPRARLRADRGPRGAGGAASSPTD